MKKMSLRNFEFLRLVFISILNYPLSSPWERAVR